VAISWASAHVAEPARALAGALAGVALAGVALAGVALAGVALAGVALAGAAAPVDDGGAVSPADLLHATSPTTTIPTSTLFIRPG
jgi:hypothetical protein